MCLIFCMWVAWEIVGTGRSPPCYYIQGAQFPSSQILTDTAFVKVVSQSCNTAFVKVVSQDCEVSSLSNFILYIHICNETLPFFKVRQVLLESTGKRHAGQIVVFEMKVEIKCVSICSEKDI